MEPITYSNLRLFRIMLVANYLRINSKPEPIVDLDKLTTC